MNLQELAAKLTGLSARFDALEASAKSANETSAGLTADLEAAATEHKTLSEANAALTEANATLTEANATLTEANATLTTEQAASVARVAELEAAATNVREAGSLEAIEIAAAQGTAPAESAESAETGATKSEAKLLEEMAALPIGERHAFYQANRAVLNPFQ